ncbi:MAG: polynucleotide adenylyltransferase PcnB, partial [Gammaproteobacteria bacterium]|nr:polynucleotide adenylyltransferase PcnB [Gammaproteobacteria bacterium]
DLMLGREPKDFDVVTDARPEEIRKLFSSARIIGRRFRLVHVRFGRGIIEVATFRAIPRDISEEGRPDEDMTNDTGEVEEAPVSVADQNIFGNQEEDARRRDFTVNALYYDIRDFSVVDYANGVEDLKAGVLRTIGDPEARYREDPVRMLRVVRFAAKLAFKIEAKTEAPIERLAHLLATVPPARMFEEVLKLFHGGYALETFELLRRYNLFQYLFPLTDECLSREDVLQEQLQHVSIPRRFSVPMREIWAMQERLGRRGGRQAFRLLEDKRFRAAYDFLLLRADTGEAPKELAEWWTRFQEVDAAEREAMVATQAPAAASGGGEKKKRRRRRRRKARPPEQPSLG